MCSFKINIFLKKQQFFVYLNSNKQKIFFVQKIFGLKKKTKLTKFWFFYVLKVLYHFGLFDFKLYNYKNIKKSFKI